MLAFLTIAAAFHAQAQVVVGGDRAPSVSVDLTVLDRLGPAPTLPQLFGASRDGGTSAAAAPKTARAAKPALHRSSTKRASAVAKKHARTHRVVRHKAKNRTRVAHAQKPRSVAAASGSSVIHLTPPAGMPTTHAARSSRLLPGLAAGVTPASAVVTPAPPPAAPPLPPLPQATAAPSAPAIAPTQPPEEAPAPPKPQTEAHDDSAPVSLMAAQPSAEQQTSSNPPAPAAAVNPPAPAPAVAEKPAAAPPPAPHPAPVQLASSGAVASTANVVKFAPGAADLPPNSQAVLDGVAAKLLASDALRVQLIAHATGDADQAMEARRISLARAVAVRAYLIDKGVRSLRMDVRALGNRADDGPASDQVDLVIVSQ